MSTGLAAYEALGQRMQAPNAELLPRVIKWLQKTVPTGAKAPRYVQASASGHGGKWKCHLSIRTQKDLVYKDFAIAPTVPIPLTEADYAIVGLVGPYRPTLIMNWLLELIADAWIHSGLYDQKIPLVLGSRTYLGPGKRQQWSDIMKSMAYRTTAPRPASIKAPSTEQGELVQPPFPSSLPPTPPKHQDACRAGKPDAVRAWADALETAGDAPSAELLRWLDSFVETVRADVVKWSGRGAFWVFATASDCWWGSGENGTEPDNNEEPSQRLAQLLAGWNVYHPAVEWFFRRLSLRYIDLSVAFYADGNQSENLSFDLDDGQHFTPLPETQGVANCWADTEKRPEEDEDWEDD